MEPPERYKREDQLNGDEMLRLIQAQNRGESPPRFETDEYRRYRVTVLRAGGMDDEAGERESQEAKLVDKMTPADHLADIRQGRWA